MLSQYHFESSQTLFGYLAVVITRGILVLGQILEHLFWEEGLPHPEMSSECEECPAVGTGIRLSSFTGVKQEESYGK